MPNRLAREQSPYLLQHKDNPVDWRPWGEAAFAEARAEDKPLFVSIGYATCHWCHVMAHESFEDAEVARLMNEAFVPVKVDREERPDVDSLYMTVCQMMTGRGGWPLNVLLTPEGEPFHAMTYLPKTGRFGQMGLLELIPRLRELWQDERERVERSAASVTGALREAEAQPAAGDDLDDLDAHVLDAAYEALAGRFDAARGGFGGAPKFPSPHVLIFLLRYAHRTGAERALKMVEKTLDAMRRGGLFDHVGGGFHRYSTDAEWRLPHFEKMLYDQAMHAWAYAEAYEATGAARFRRTAEEVIAYVLRDLRGPEGAFYSAEDADSEGREGAFYVWTVEEVKEVLEEPLAERVIAAYDLHVEGNFADESTRERTGENVLHQARPLPDVAEELNITEDELRADLKRAREQLFARREERERPLLDDKVLTDWNGLMIAALARAARAFDAPAYADAASKAADFILEKMRDAEGRLLHRYRGGEAAIRAHLDDYAFLIYGLTALYEATFDPRWLEEATALADELTARFADDDRGGFYLTADDAEELLVRQKSFYDGALPSGNAMALAGLVRLARLTGRADLEEHAASVARAAGAHVRRQPAGFTALLSGLDLALGPAREVVISGDPAAADTQALLHVLRAAYRPRSVALLRSGERAAALARVAPFTEAQTPVEGRAAAYVCEGHQCQAPTTDPAALRAALEA